MTTAGQVAIELRKLADALDAKPEEKVIRPYVLFSATTKDEFLNTARLLPHPLKKREDNHGDSKYHKIYVEHINPSVDISVSVYKSLTCELIAPARPAVYRCVPIFSAAEDESLEVAP